MVPVSSARPVFVFVFFKTGFEQVSGTLFQLAGSSSKRVGGGGRVYGRRPRAAAGPGAAGRTAAASTFWRGALLLEARGEESEIRTGRIRKRARKPNAGLKSGSP